MEERNSLFVVPRVRKEWLVADQYKLWFEFRSLLPTAKVKHNCYPHCALKYSPFEEVSNWRLQADFANRAVWVSPSTLTLWLCSAHVCGRSLGHLYRGRWCRMVCLETSLWVYCKNLLCGGTTRPAMELLIFIWNMTIDQSNTWHFCSWKTIFCMLIWHDEWIHNSEPIYCTNLWLIIVF